jgi:Beta-galactosidase
MAMPGPRHLKEPPAPKPPRHAGPPRRRLSRMAATALALTLIASAITVVSANATNHGTRRPGFGLLPALLFDGRDRQASERREPAAQPRPAARPRPAAPTTTTSAAPDAEPSGGQGGGTLKEASSGLVLTSPNALRQYPFINNITIQSAGWADLEPRPGAYDFSPIDRVLQAHPEARARLRIYAGFRAPRWLDGVAGACVPVGGGVSGRSGCAPRFWTDAYLDRFERFMAALAQRYEANPRVVEVINSACSTVFAEPFILGIGSDRDSAQRLAAAGLNEASHRNCLERSTAAMARVFGSTRVVLDGHTKWQLVTSDGRRADSWEKERDLLNELRARYGAKLVVEDHGLGPEDSCIPGQSLANAGSWYCWLASLPAPKGFQFTLRGGSMSAAAANGVGMRACFLEFAGFTKIDARTVDARLEGNPGC